MGSGGGGGVYLVWLVAFSKRVRYPGLLSRQSLLAVNVSRIQGNRVMAADTRTPDLIPSSFAFQFKSALSRYLQLVCTWPTNWL